MPLTRGGQQTGAISLGAKKYMLLMDGRRAHAAGSFQGYRTSVVWFAMEKARKWYAHKAEALKAKFVVVSDALWSVVDGCAQPASALLGVRGRR